jgi:hypothetical protein
MTQSTTGLELFLNQRIPCNWYLETTLDAARITNPALGISQVKILGNARTMVGSYKEELPRLPYVGWFLQRRHHMIHVSPEWALNAATLLDEIWTGAAGVDMVKWLL